MKSLFAFVGLLLICPVLPAFGQKWVPIDQMLIKGNFSLTFVDSNLTISPNQKFNLSTSGIRENDRKVDLGTLDIRDCRSRIVRSREIKGGEKITTYCWPAVPLHYYDVVIKNFDNQKTYYGLLLLFQTLKDRYTQPVSQYYQIGISNELFQQTSNGNYSYTYEYSTGNQAILTWVLFFSEAPFPPIKN
jgi:hypothetical protein